MEVLILVLLIIFAFGFAIYLMVSGAIKIPFVNNSSENSEKQHADPLESYYEWPKENLFGFRLTKSSIYQNDIQQLSTKYTIPLETDCDYKIEVMTAHLILEDDNPFDGNAVRVEIDSITVGYIMGNSANSFRRIIRKLNLYCHITLCKAIFFKEIIVSRNNNVDYEVKLDLYLIEQEDQSLIII